AAVALLAEARLVEQVRVATAALGRVHRDVGPADERVGVGDVLRTDGDTDAHADGRHAAVADVHRHLQLPLQPFDHPGDPVDVDGAAEQDGELVTTQAGGRVGRSQAAADPVGHRA